MPATVEAIEELYRSRYASYRGGVAALTGSYDGARDVVQEAFAQAIRDRREYRGDGPLAAWVWRIARPTAQRRTTARIGKMYCGGPEGGSGRGPRGGNSRSSSRPRSLWRPRWPAFSPLAGRDRA